MKSILAAAAAIGLLAAAAAPATAGRSNTFATWEDCMWAIEYEMTGHKDFWRPRCVATGDGGWKIVWTNLKRKRR